MVFSDWLGIGLILVVIGAGLWLLARFLLLSMAGGPPSGLQVSPQVEVVQAEESQDAILVVRKGGKIVTLTRRARQAFALDADDVPNLERLARKIRPSETFLSLCAHQGQARLVLSGRLVDALSYCMNIGQNPVMLLTLRFLELAADLESSPKGGGSETLQIFSELTQTMAGSLDFDATLQAVQQSVEKLIPTDFLEITVWDPSSETLAPYRFVGLPGAERKLELSRQRYNLGEGYSGTIARTQAPMLVGNIDLRSDLRPAVDHNEIPIRSYIGVPLLVSNELVGTLELGSLEIEAYQQDDLNLLNLLAGQAAVVIRNAVRYRSEQRRTAEMAGLAQLTQSFSVVRDPKNIYSRLVESILPLIPVEILGFLIYNESNRMLEGQEPFSGLPSQIIELYRASIIPGSAGERTLLNQDVIITENASESEEWENLGLSFLAQAASLHDTVLIPLTSGGRMLGYLQASNHKDGSKVFTQEELRLLMIITNQAAVAIQTAGLYQETLHLTEDLEKRVEERTTELRREHNNTETLLRIITELSNSLDLDQVINRALTVLNESIGAQQSLIYLSQNKRTYQLGMPLATSRNGGISSIAQDIARWVIQRRAPTLVDDLPVDSRWKNHEAEPVTFHSVVAVPLVLGEEILGALLLLNEQSNSFIVEQINLVEATARQFSITLNNAELLSLIRDQAENLGGMLRTQQMEASRSRAILESVADGVLVTDAANRITLCNASTERILELKADQVLMQPLEQFSGLFERASQTWLQTIQKWSKDPKAYQLETFAERLELDNGRVVAVTLAPVFFRNEFLATVSIFRDITHEVQVDRLKSEFIANVSHELKTPMTSIKGYVEVMLMGVTGQLSPQQERFLKIIKSNTERLNVLVNDILDVSRIESGRLILDMQPTDVSKLAGEVVEEYKRRSRDDGRVINFSLDVAADLPQITADPIRLRQIISSLVNNGYSYTPDEGHVNITLNADEDKIKVDVKDDGIGISDKDGRRIFERFFRGEDPMVLQTAGTGLGLAISKVLVEMHGGKIWFTSKGVHGEGSTFSFTLPVAKGED